MSKASNFSSKKRKRKLKDRKKRLIEK